MFNYHSELANIDLELPDSYKARNEILATLKANAISWFSRALARAPIELQTTLQVRERLYNSFKECSLSHSKNYLVANKTHASVNPIELGPSIALHYAVAISPSETETGRYLSYSADLI